MTVIHKGGPHEAWKYPDTKLRWALCAEGANFDKVLVTDGTKWVTSYAHNEVTCKRCVRILTSRGTYQPQRPKKEPQHEYLNRTQQTD